MDTIIRLTSPPLEKGYRLVFGDPVELRTIESEFHDSSGTEAIFHPGNIFCLEVFDRFLFGNTRWALYVAKTVEVPEKATFIPNVRPGAKVLLGVRGKTKVTQANEWISTLQLDRDPTDVHEATFCKQHAILNTSFAPRTPRKPFF